MKQKGAFWGSASKDQTRCYFGMCDTNDTDCASPTITEKTVKAMLLNAKIKAELNVQSKAQF